MNINPPGPIREQPPVINKVGAPSPAGPGDSDADSVTITANQIRGTITPEGLSKLFEDQQFAPFIAKDGPVCEAVEKRLKEREWPSHMVLDLKGQNVEDTKCFQNGDLLLQIGDEYCRINGSSGKVMWRRKLEGMTSGDYPKELLKDGNLFVKYGSNLCKVDGKTGDVIWENKFPGRYAFHQINRLEGGDYIVHYCTTLYRVDGSTGKIKWEQPYGNLDEIHYCDQALPDGPIYTITARLPTYTGKNGRFEMKKPQSVMVALNPDTGNEIPGFNKIENATGRRLNKNEMIFFRAGDEVGAARLDGKELFRVSCPRGLVFPLMESDDAGTLYVTGAKGTRAISKEGKVLWETPECKDIKLYPGDPDNVYVRSNSRTYIRDRKTGEKRGETRGRILQVRNGTALCVEGNRLSLLDTKNGTPRWQVTRPIGYDGVLLDENDTMYTFGSSNQNVVSATDTITGKELWSISMGDSELTGQKALGKKGMLYLSDDTHIWGIDVKSGKVKKCMGYRPEYLIEMSLNSDENALLIRDGEGNYQMINTADFADVDEEYRAAMAEFKKSVVADEVSAAEKCPMTIEQDEESVYIDGIHLERRNCTGE